MKKVLLIILVMLLGIGLLSYPHIANYFSEKNASTAIQNYQNTVKNNPKKLKQEWEKADIYNQQLTGSAIRDPFLPGSGKILDDNYFEILNINGMMGYIRIPKIDVDLAIYHGTTDEVLSEGVGHLEGSAMPVGGEGSHAVLTGHTGLVKAKLLTDLQLVAEGDLFFLHILDQVLAYQVDQIKVVDPNVTRDLLPVEGEDYVTIITCTPYSVNSHRLLVRGTRVPYTPALEEKAAQQIAGGLSQEMRLTLIAVSVSIITVVIFIIILSLLKRKKNKKEELEKNQKGE